MIEANELCLSVPWGTVAAKAWGSPSDFPVLCVHGLLDNAGAFDRLIDQLQRNYYYVAIDLPGHGLSSHFSTGIPLDFFNYVLAIRYVVEEMKWKSFYYIGHSLGGQLGTFYSAIYPGQIQKMILIEGIVPKIVRNKDMITRLRNDHNSVIKTKDESKQRLYTHDEVMYTLKYQRNVCLNSNAAKAIFKRSVSEIGGMLKYNRDFRLRTYLIPLLNFEHIVTILDNLNVEVLCFFTKGSIDVLSYENRAMISFLQNDNFKIIYVDGNHDVHNNNPDRISYDIIKFLNHSVILSKL